MSIIEAIETFLAEELELAVEDDVQDIDEEDAGAELEDEFELTFTLTELPEESELSVGVVDAEEGGVGRKSRGRKFLGLL